MDEPRCYFPLENDELCMELVAQLGHRCQAHTWAEPMPPVRVIRQRVPPADNLRCIGIKKDGQRCTHKRRLGSDRCGTHQARAPVQVCTGIRADGEPCTKPGKFNGLCGTHNLKRIRNEIRDSNLAWHDYDIAEFRAIVRTKKIEQRVRQRQLDTMRIQLEGALNPELLVDYNNLQMEYIAIAGQLTRMSIVVKRDLMRLPAEPLVGTLEEISARARQRVEAVVHDFEEADGVRRRLMEMRVGHVHHNNPLAAFAHDRQNVHTTETNLMVRNINIRLQEVSPTNDSLREIAWEWNAASLGTAQQRNSVRSDMEHWYNEANVSTLNDFAYKNMLDRVWALIDASQHRKDMIVRLWEECVDSLGMCAAGHLTRLANAVQGFDENAPILEESRSERLQNAMAQISQLDPGERESAARRIFAELGVEGDAQTPWLEALL
jgi:hypothetical protein